MVTALIICLIVISILLIVFIVFYNKEKMKVLNTNETLSKWISEYEESERLLRSYEITVENYENLLVKITDKLPKRMDARGFAMKLSNELAEYFKVNEEEGTVSLIVYKGNI